MMLDAAPELGWWLIVGTTGTAIVMLLKPRVVAFIARRKRYMQVRRLLADSPYSSRPVPRESLLDRLIAWADAHYPDTERRRMR
jgi:hypothetical protein